MQLRAMRIRKGRQQKELAKAIGTDEPMMSKFENYKCLPIPPMMKALCDELGCEVGDIYEPHEIFLTSPKVTVKVSKGSKKKKSFIISRSTFLRKRESSSKRLSANADSRILQVGSIIASRD